MTQRATPAIPLFGDAYIADTRHLSLEEHGAYLNLLMIAWRTEDCSLPDDDARLARMLGVTPKKWAALKPTVMAFWSLDNGRWTQKRLSKERRFVAKKSDDNRAAANARWNAKPLKNNEAADANAMPERCMNDAPPPPIKKPSVSTRAREIPDGWEPEPFAEGTDAYSIESQWSADERRGQIERFVDYHRAKGSRFKDWQAAWGTWVRNSTTFTTKPRALSDNRLPGEPIPMWKHLRQQRQASGGR